MALLENNVRRRLSYLYFMETNLKLFVQQKSHKFTQRLH
jgi:hypothetical protein